MQKYRLIACFSPVIKVNIGEHKFDGTSFEKIGVLAIQKVAKTGNIGKKKTSSGRRYQLCKIPQHADG